MSRVRARFALPVGRAALATLLSGMPTAAPAVHRIEVRSRHGQTDPRGAALVRDGCAIGLPITSAMVAQIYLIEADLEPEQLQAVADRLLADPVTESAAEGAAPAPRDASTIEVHPLPGVMDPVAQSVREAMRELLGLEGTDDIQVSTALRYDLVGLSATEAGTLARRLLANPVIHAIHTKPFCPKELPRGHAYALKVARIPLRTLSDEQLTKLSRDAHLFLSLDEMKAIQAEYRRLEREPTDIELETLAQTWSEHCVHKTLKSRIRYRNDGATERRSDGGEDPIDWNGRPGHTVHPDGTVTIDNLLKSTVAAATYELIADGVDWTLSVFKDNAGIIAFDDTTAVCVKVETHNHPSALEPYGGAATGIGGCIRDVIGTGLGARPIASTDVFCVAYPDRWSETGADPATAALPPGTLHPRRTLTQVVAGVRDYGNRMGIPTVSGAVAFDDRYVGNPLVFCGCIGVMPRTRTHGRTRPGDLIIALGGRTGRDGIHGATFSSAELEQTHADEFSHAVQIGNAIEEKRVLDAIIRARDQHAEPLFTALTDCGAGGFSSAVGEMGSLVGAQVDLEKAPLKYAGLSYTEIWISEAQERMVLAVPPANLESLQAMCDEENVELSVLGRFGALDAAGKPELVLRYHNTEVGRLPMHLLHDGLPQPVREAVWAPRDEQQTANSEQPRTTERGVVDVRTSLLALLSHPNIASKHWIIRQYDHEVQGNTLIKPLVGPAGRGPSDAAVIEPVPGSRRGLAISCGLQTGIGDLAIGGDPYLMALGAIDECVRNLVCIGADPSRIAILDNFCWPSCAKPENLGSLVRAAEGCYDGAKAYRTPFVSGKDSLNNQLRYTDPATGKERLIEIPPTLLITGIGIVPDIGRCITMDAKRAGNALILIGRTTADLGGSHLQQVIQTVGASRVPSTDLSSGPRLARAVYDLVGAGLVRSAHDCSDGGLLAAAAEMLIASGDDLAGLGATLDLSAVHEDPIVAAFAETPSRYLLEVEAGDLPRVESHLRSLPWCRIGHVTDSGRLRWPGAGLDVPVGDLARAWLGPLDW
jgi:phosphoribosylformylglycinamidine synthase subunit PurSL